MSYITLPRLSFSGRFQADVSTVNNDVRHYDTENFEDRFQDYQTSDVLNGSWNPDGTGSFRLFDVTIKQALDASGNDDALDAATGLYVNAQIDRSAAKLVDLDPQFQMGSAIWGMRIKLTDGNTEFMRATLSTNTFRDIYFGRVRTATSSEAASAKFTSVLENVEWTRAADRSPVLKALKEACQANDNRLSLNFMTFGFVRDPKSKNYTFGNVTGSIGIWEKGSPLHFVLGRRFAPAVVPNGDANGAGIGFFDGDTANDFLSLDLSNAMPLEDMDGNTFDLGPLKVAVLLDQDTQDPETGAAHATIHENQTLTGCQILSLGEIPYRDPNWLLNTAGIVDFPLSDTAKELIADHPLAIVTPLECGKCSHVVRIRETVGGLFARADDWQQRVDAPAKGVAHLKTTIHAAQYGKPAKVPLQFSLNPPEEGLSGADGIDINPPKAVVPVIGTPSDAVHFAGSGSTGKNGKYNLDMYFFDPRNPRGYVDGQIYKINYEIALDGLSSMPSFEMILVHVRDPYAVPKNPTWDEHIKPLMEQYGNLYPVMSKGLFSFVNEEMWKERAPILLFAFTRPLDDPNHMPVTRDLSESKLQTIVNWLKQFVDADTAKMADTMMRASAQTVLAASETPGPAPVGLGARWKSPSPIVLAGHDDRKNDAAKKKLPTFNEIG